MNRCKMLRYPFTLNKALENRNRLRPILLINLHVHSLEKLNSTPCPA